MEPIFTTGKSGLLIALFDTIFPNINYDFPDAVKDLNLIHRPTIKIFGKEAHQNRDIGFFSDESKGYKYSNQLMSSQQLTPQLKLILDYVNAAFVPTNQPKYNGILINRYNDGNDNIGAHSDDEKSLSPTGVIAISLGATRKFRLRSKYAGLPYQILTTKYTPEIETSIGKISNKKGEILFDLPMTNKMIVWMYGDFQKELTHEIPKEARVTEPRISLTFRSHTE